MQYLEYFVWKRPSCPASFRVVHREVKSRTQKGYPISFALMAIPGEYDEWEAAQHMADQLNQGFSPDKTEEWLEDEQETY